MYRVVRVNTKAHNTRLVALDDMAWIIERGFYWKKSSRIDIPVGTPLVAMGSHGGQGLFLFGISNGNWEREEDGGEYQHRIPVVWQPMIYERRPISEVEDMLSKFNVRFGAEAHRHEFANVLSFVLNGTHIVPDYHWNEQAA
jgi:hypothetical protein